MSSAQDDAKLNIHQGSGRGTLTTLNTNAQSTQTTATPFTISGPPQEQTTDTPLSANAFYTMIGIARPADAHNDAAAEAARPTPISGGLYDCIRRRHRRLSRQYRLFEGMTYVLLGAQLVLSALFIIFGTSPGHFKIAVAVLGAVSTVVAGILALTKGQGLPTRLRQERDALWRVYLEAEELCWDVAAGRQVAYKDIEDLRAAFAGVYDTAARNHPDFWDDAATSEAQSVTRNTQAEPAARDANPSSTPPTTLPVLGRTGLANISAAGKGKGNME